jgi:hypothetical protein
LSLNAGRRFLDIVFDVLGKIEIDTREFPFQTIFHLLGQFLLVHALWPSVEWFQGYEEFDIEEAGGVGPIVRTAMLRHDGFRLGIASDQFTHPVYVTIALFKRDGSRHCCPNPQIALLQMGQEFRAQLSQRTDRNDHQYRCATQRQNLVHESKFYDRSIETFEAAYNEGLDFAHLVGQK